MSENQLPPVAKNFHTFCKKCDADRYHVVLAHTSAKSAKLKCEVCGAARTYTLTAAKKAGAVKKPGGTRRAASESARRSSHNAEYESLLAGSKNNEVPYSMKQKFEKNQKVSHPKFGLGIVKETHTDKIEIIFADEVRALVHNRI